MKKERKNNMDSIWRQDDNKHKRLQKDDDQCANEANIMIFFKITFFSYAYKTTFVGLLVKLKKKCPSN